MSTNEQVWTPRPEQILEGALYLYQTIPFGANTIIYMIQ